MTWLLIHGGGATARFWDRLVPLLDGPSLAVDLPGRGGKPADLATLTVDEEVASVVADVEAAGVDDPIVVVAHSSGGLVVPGVVAALGPRVRHVVLNAALVPVEGGCGVDCMKERHREGLIFAREAAAADGTAITLPGPPADPESFRNAYGGDPLDDFQPVHWSKVAGVPITYVLNERDRPVLPEAQEVMSARLPEPATVVRVDSGHLLPVTAPGAFAALLADLPA